MKFFQVDSENTHIDRVFYVDRVVEKCVSINPRGSHLMLQTNLDELILAETESGHQVNALLITIILLK